MTVFSQISKTILLHRLFYCLEYLISILRKILAACDTVTKDECQSLKFLTKQPWRLINEKHSKRREGLENMDNINEGKNMWTAARVNEYDKQEE